MMRWGMKNWTEVPARKTTSVVSNKLFFEFNIYRMLVNKLFLNPQTYADDLDHQ